MVARLSKMNTLRNQILVVFLLAMGIVLLLVGIMTFQLVSTLLKNNAEKQMQQTAVQASGRLETLYQQIDMLSQQVATNSYVQQLLIAESDGHRSDFYKRQSLMQIINSYQAYSDGIHSFELYLPSYRRLLPLGEGHLAKRLDPNWVKQANLAKGKMVWAGTDPKDPGYFLTIRRVSLMDRWFSNGGYLVIRINAGFFQLNEAASTGKEHEYMVLVDEHNRTIASNYSGDSRPIFAEHQQVVTIHGQEYIVVKEKSEGTGWTLAILTPISTLMEGITVLRTAITISAAAGFVIFLVFSYLLSTIITRPILTLTKTMRRARQGELKPSPHHFSTVEINELNQTYNQLAENTNHLIQVVYEKELLRSRSELKALQAQINPHFLFNTLDALYWSLEEKREEELAELVIAMSELFRYTISDPKQDEWVSVKEELEHVDRYLQIMKMRFGERLTWEISAAAVCEEARMPKLLIQPLVENAILHGVGNKMGHGSVSITAERLADERKVVITVKDDGPGIAPDALQAIRRSLEEGKVSPLKGKGMAIANVKKRLQLYYQDYQASGLYIRSDAGQGTCVSLEIPCEGGLP